MEDKKNIIEKITGLFKSEEVVENEVVETELEATEETVETELEVAEEAVEAVDETTDEVEETEITIESLSEQLISLAETVATLEARVLELEGGEVPAEEEVVEEVVEEEMSTDETPEVNKVEELETQLSELKSQLEKFSNEDAAEVVLNADAEKSNGLNPSMEIKARIERQRKALNK